MSDVAIEKFGIHAGDGCLSSAGGEVARGLAEDIAAHFRKNYPVMLDGALPRSGDRRSFVRRARESLCGGVGREMLPASILREALESVRPVGVRDGASPAKAGLTAVGARTGRVWWDGSVLDNLEDVLARLDEPRAVLRFYDVTGLDSESGRWNEFFDIDVDIGTHGQTVNFWSGDRAYVVELGYVHADGRFLRLARTNLVHLPREGRGVADGGETAGALLKPRVRQVDSEVIPDVEAREWVMSRRDFSGRDIESELVVHMVYRSFLREGPRALRRAPRLFRRDPEVLRREYMRRERERVRGVEAGSGVVTAPVFLVARLDVGREGVVGGVAGVPAVVGGGVLSECVKCFDSGRFGWFAGLFGSARSVTLARALPRLDDAVVRVETESEEPAELVSVISGRGRGGVFGSSSVFEAAKNLRESLVGMPSFGGEDVVEGGDLVEGFSGGSSVEVEDESLRVFGGAEAKRMAKAGVRITRMSLTLEGRMRPGARLKVAGKLVHADADGRFRLECVLTGRRASIPMRAGASIGGEARSLINVEWEKRASREKKKIW